MFKKYLHEYNNISPVVKAGLWFTVCNLLQKGISFITVPIFTRIMTSEDYGLYSIYLSWYSVITIFATLHLSYFVFNKGLIKYEEDKENFVVSIQSLSATVTIGFILIYILLHDYIDSLAKLPSSMMLCMLVQILFEPPVLYWTARKRFEYEYQAVVTVTIAMALLNPLLGILLIKMGAFSNGAIARAFSLALFATLFGIVTGISIIKKADTPFSTKYWHYALGYNLPLIPHFLSTTILSSADRIMIGDMCGNTEAAIYSVAYAIGMVCLLFSQAIQQAYLPWLYKRMKVENYDGIPKITNAFMIIIIGILSLLICFAPEVVLIVGSNKYVDATWAVPPICGSIFFIFLQNLFANIEYYFEKTKLIASASVGVAVLNIILNYIFIGMFGYVAAAYTTLVCYMAYALIHYFVMVHICKQNGIDVSNLFDMRITTIFSLSMIAIVGIMLAVYHNSLIRYIFILAIVTILCIKHKNIINMIKMIRN